MQRSAIQRILLFNVQLQRCVLNLSKIEIDRLLVSLAAGSRVFLLTKKFENVGKVSDMSQWQEAGIHSECTTFGILFEVFSSQSNRPDLDFQI